MTDTKTMTAPVSLADIRAKGRFLNGVPRTPTGYVILFDTERDALVELAEAYLAVRQLDPLYGSDLQAGREYADARARLALAAKGVRP